MVQMRTLMVVVLGAIVVGLPVFSPMLRAEKGLATPTEATVPQLERDIPELMKKAGVPGLAVVEQITGKSLNEYMTEAVCTPRGMTSSAYVWWPDFDTLTPTGYHSHGKRTELEKPTEAGAASTLNTTAKDYALFAEAVLTGKGLKPATVREMETPEIALDPECRICLKHEPKQLSKNLFWGLGWGIERKDGTDALWHWGDNGSFKGFVMAELKTKSGVVMFANSENGLEVAKPVVDETMGRGSLAFDWLK